MYIYIYIYIYISENTITMFADNLQSLSKHIDDVACDDRIINNNITRFTETQIQPSDSTCKIMNFFQY